MKEKLPAVRIEFPGDPDRCQANDANGNQCNMKRYKDSQYCTRHNGAMGETQATNRNYYLQRFHSQLSQKTSSTSINSLRDEIGILRMTLEAFLNKCSTLEELMQYCAPIDALTGKIERLVATNHKIEKALGEMLDRTTLNTFASGIIRLVSEVLKDDPTKIGEIAEGILKILDTLLEGNEDQG